MLGTVTRDSSCLGEAGRGIRSGSVGTVTVEGSLTGDPAELGPNATPVIEAGGSVGLLTVGTAAAGESVGGRFVPQLR